MVDLLHIPLVRLRRIESGAIRDAVALVDTQPATATTPCRAGDAAGGLEHHGRRRRPHRVPWADVRSDSGATATILTGVPERPPACPLTGRHATGLFYAIRSETQNLKREGASAESNAFREALPAGWIAGSSGRSSRLPSPTLSGSAGTGRSERPASTASCRSPPGDAALPGCRWELARSPAASERRALGDGHGALPGQASTCRSARKAAAHQRPPTRSAGSRHARPRPEATA